MCPALGLGAPEALGLTLLSVAEARALGRTCSAQSNRLDTATGCRTFFDPDFLMDFDRIHYM